MRELEFIAEALGDVTPYVRERWTSRAGLGVTGKSAGVNDVLTEVDLEVQRRLVEAIGKAFPGDAIVAEEAGMHGLPDDRRVRCWFIDPIDGTQNFVRGMFPEFGVSLAFADEGDVRAGGVSMAGAGELMLAGKGLGATRNGAPMRVSDVDALDAARVDIDFGYPHQRQDVLDRFTTVIREAGQFRCYCAAIMGLCSVACGETDAYAAPETQPWDSAAGALLVTEAGGMSTTITGEPLNLALGKNSIVVSNGRIHDAVLAHIEHPAGSRAD